MNDYKIILGIETSCDETAAAVLEKKNGKIIILSNIVTSSATLQATFGGVIPEQAAREQLKSVIPVIATAITESGKRVEEIDALAVTQGPGLIGSLLVGTETAKTLSLAWNKPIIPINHLIGHFYANWIWDKNVSKTPSFPCIGLLVSGGHTDLVLFKDYGKHIYLGGTRDDAAGECFDKSARLLGLPYPGGPQISLLAKKGDSEKIKLPAPMIDSKDFDFSFSGLKTAVANLVKNDLKINKADVAASLEKTIINVLIKKTLAAAEQYEVNEIIIAGGVASNPNLSEGLRRNFHGLVFCPSHNICTDNGAMIASAGFFSDKTVDPLSLQANPNLSLT
jgi:N6-L-threonylcarbamoyladenine synthase